MTMTHRATPCSHQRGAVLLISLMILLVMTVIGISAMSTTTMEEKMAGNNQQRQQAFQGAESALRDAEAWLTNSVTVVADLDQFDDGNNGLYALERTTPGASILEPTFDIYDNNDWLANGIQAPPLLANQPRPRYIIEYIGKIGGPPLDPNDVATPPRYNFRITAVGWSVDNTARFLAWSHFARRLN